MYDEIDRKLNSYVNNNRHETHRLTHRIKDYDINKFNHLYFKKSIENRQTKQGIKQEGFLRASQIELYRLLE